jgi:hypothetical protein
VVSWQLVLAFVSPVSGLIVAVGALFWGRQVIENKDAQIEVLKQLSAASVLPQIQAMKELHQFELEQERDKLQAVHGEERKRLELHIGELQSQVDALIKVGEVWPEALNLTAKIEARSSVSANLSRLVGPPNQ